MKKKNTMTVANTETTPKAGHSFIPAAYDVGRKDREARNDGRNSHTEDLASAGIGKFLLLNFTTFCFSDFLKLCGRLDIPFAEKEVWFAAFVKEALSKNQIRSVPTCYSEPVYKVTL